MSTRAKVQIIGDGAVYTVYRIQDGIAAVIISELLRALDTLPNPSELAGKLLFNPAYTPTPFVNVDTQYQVVYDDIGIRVSVLVAAQ